MKIIKSVQKVVKETARAFMMPMLDGTGLVPVETYNSKGWLVKSTLVKENRSVMTARVQA